jgi:hypothetical protein
MTGPIFKTLPIPIKKIENHGAGRGPAEPKGGSAPGYMYHTIVCALKLTHGPKPPK